MKTTLITILAAASLVACTGETKPAAPKAEIISVRCDVTTVSRKPGRPEQKKEVVGFTFGTQMLWNSTSNKLEPVKQARFGPNLFTHGDNRTPTPGNPQRLERNVFIDAGEVVVIEHHEFDELIVLTNISLNRNTGVFSYKQTFADRANPRLITESHTSDGFCVKADKL